MSIVLAIVAIIVTGLYFGGVISKKGGTVGEEQIAVPVTVGNSAYGPPPALTGTSVTTLGKFGINPWGVNAAFAAPTAFWIWNSQTAATDAPANVPVTFKTQFWNSGSTPINATLHIVVDNDATVNLNGSDIGKASGGWGNANYPKMPVTLQPGNNLFTIVATNGGGPAGLLAAVIDPSGKVLLQTDHTWVTA